MTGSRPALLLSNAIRMSQTHGYDQAGPRHKCPRCGSRKNATLVYGLPAAPSPEIRRDVALGHIHFAGCIVTFNDPRWSCNSCGALFGLPGETAPNFTVLTREELVG
jgi:ribosomal protein L37AE/L43A